MRVAKIWLTEPHSACPHYENQNGGLDRALDFTLTKAGKDSFSIEAGAKQIVKALEKGKSITVVISPLNAMMRSYQ